MEVPVLVYLASILSCPIAANSNGGRGITVVVEFVIPAIGGSIKCTRHCATLWKCCYSMAFANR